MTQPDLFSVWDIEPPSVADSPTSIAAAKQIEPKAKRDRRRVFEFIRDQGERGATDAEMQMCLSLSGDTQRPRRWELHKAGLIRDSGRTRLTPAGNKAVVWTIVEGKA